MEDIKLDVREFLSQFIGSVNITDTDNIFELGLVNSLFAMQLIAYLERKYAVKLIGKGVSLANFNSIEGISALVQAKINEVSNLL